MLCCYVYIQSIIIVIIYFGLFLREFILTYIGLGIIYAYKFLCRKISVEINFVVVFTISEFEYQTK